MKTFLITLIALILHSLMVTGMVGLFNLSSFWGYAGGGLISVFYYVLFGKWLKKKLE